MNDQCDQMVNLRLGMIIVANYSGWKLVKEEIGTSNDKNYKSHQQVGERGESSCSAASPSLHQSYLFRKCVWQEKEGSSRFMTLSVYGKTDSIPEDLQVLLYQRTIEYFRDYFL